MTNKKKAASFAVNISSLLFQLILLLYIFELWSNESITESFIDLVAYVHASILALTANYGQYFVPLRLVRGTVYAKQLALAEKLSIFSIKKT
jgi:hypothetical protein